MHTIQVNSKKYLDYMFQKICVVHNYIYIQLRNEWYYMDVKYSKKWISMGHEWKFVFANSDYLVLEKEYGWYLWGKHKMIIQKADEIYIVKNFLMLCYYPYCGYSYTSIYDLEKGRILDCELKLYFFDNLKFVRNYVLVHIFQTWYMFCSFDDMLNFLQNDNRNHIISEFMFDNFVPKNNNQLVAINNINTIINYLIIFDIFGTIIKQINVCKYNVKYDIDAIVCAEGNIYLWDASIILVIDCYLNIIVLANIYSITHYIQHYGVFINKDFASFRYCGGEIIRHKFSYDYWRDTEKPENIEKIIFTLIEIDLFPLDVCNIIYGQLINILKNN